MRKMFFLLLFCPLLADAQRSEYDIAFQKSIPDSLIQPIHMPERDYSDFNYDVITDYKERRKVLIIRSDSLYRIFFSKYRYTDDSLMRYKNSGGDAWWFNWMERHHIDSLPVIDFSKNELMVYVACPQCLAYCDNYEPCHRNACSFREAWFIREKKHSSNAKPVIRKSLLDFFTDTDIDTDIDTDTLPGRKRKWVNLPELFRYEITKFFEVGHKSSSRYVVGTDSLYYKIFSKYTKDSLPFFDFTKQELMVSFSCYYCSSLGLLNGQPRHRNACAYMTFWSVRDKKQINGEQDLQGGL